MTQSAGTKETKPRIVYQVEHSFRNEVKMKIFSGIKKIERICC